MRVEVEHVGVLAVGAARELEPRAAVGQRGSGRSGATQRRVACADRACRAAGRRVRVPQPASATATPRQQGHGAGGAVHARVIVVSTLRLLDAHSGPARADRGFAVRPFLECAPSTTHPLPPDAFVQPHRRTASTPSTPASSAPRFDAAYLIVEDGRAAFIDTGTNDSVPRLLAALDALGLRPTAVDCVIPTHVHLDHAGGAGLLMQRAAERAAGGASARRAAHDRPAPR